MISKSEKLVLQAYLNLPVRTLLNHQFELDEDYLAGFISRFLKGERFKQSFVAFTNEQLDVINSLISSNIEKEEGKDLLTAVLLTKAVCNILNKYRRN